MSMSAIRVAQVVGCMNGGGVESVVMNYYRHIDRTRVQFDFLVNADSTQIPRREIEGLGGRVYEIPPYSRLFEYRDELTRLFRSSRWEIVHSHVNSLSVLPLSIAKRSGVPVRIAHSHSTSGKGEILKNIVKRVLRTQSNRYPTHRFACSNDAGEWLFGKSHDYEVIANAIDLERFKFDEGARAALRGDLGIGEDAVVVGHVGRFMLQKNHAFLIDMFEQYHQVNDNSYLVLVGTGSLMNEIRETVSERSLNDCVVFLGQKEDVERMYSAFDVFCLPSLYEGLGVVAIEAQAAGCRCLLSTEVPHEADVTNQCAFLPINDPCVWAEAVADLMQNERNKVDWRDFSAYEIGSASEKLADRYEAMLGKA